MLFYLGFLLPYCNNIRNASEMPNQADTHRPSLAMRFCSSASAIRPAVPSWRLIISMWSRKRWYRCLYTSPSNGRTSCTPFLHSESAQKTWCWRGASMTNELRTLLQGYTVVAANAIVTRGTGTKGRKSSP